MHLRVLVGLVVVVVDALTEDLDDVPLVGQLRGGGGGHGQDGGEHNLKRLTNSNIV